MKYFFFHLKQKINFFLKNWKKTNLVRIYLAHPVYWKHNFIRNCNHSNKKGVVLLFNNEFRVNKFETDKDDCYIIVNLENSFMNLIVGNVHFPNDHTEAMSFTDNFYTKLLEFQYLFP
jgi:hypothetical protein